MARYGLLADWLRTAGLDALLTAHQTEDQAETFLMRLARGAGVKGLSAMRKVARVPGGDVPLVRPLLRWRRAELEAICAVAGVDPARDPGNDDERFERIRVRRALGQAPWLDPDAIVSSAAHLQAADAALHWATTQVWSTAVTVDDGSILFRPDGIPREIKRRVAARAIAALASEGEGSDLRGGELDRLLAALRSGRPATLRGVLCSGGEEWRFVPAPNRTRRASNPR